MKLASRMGKVTSYRSARPLEEATIRAYAPSIFAEEAHEDRSQRYAHIATGTVLKALEGEGFRPFAVAQTRVRDEGRRDYTKHMVRLRHENTIVADEAHEVILLNSHDGTSGYQMLSGIIRFACANGCIVGDMFEDVRIRHSGKVVDQVVEGAHLVLDQFGRVEESRDQMKAIELTEGEQQVFAKAALSMRYDEPADAPIAARQLLAPRRSVDHGDDLWLTFQRLQENLLKGGLRGRSASGRRTSTRAVTGVNQDVKLNRALWTLAEGMQQLKG